jgi:hypothetical protein
VAVVAARLFDSQPPAKAGSIIVKIGFPGWDVIGEIRIDKIRRTSTHLEFAGPHAYVGPHHFGFIQGDGTRFVLSGSRVTAMDCAAR